MKIRMIVGVTLLATGVCKADTVLLENDFGAGADIGPSFQQVDNGLGAGGSADTATGVITAGATTSRNSTYGLNTSSSVDVTSVAGSTGFTVAWTVSSYNGGDIFNNGMFFGVVSGTDATGTGGSSLWNNNPDAIGISLMGDHLFGDGMSLAQDAGSGASTVAASLGVEKPTSASMEDGFTVSLTVNDDNSWSAFSTGLSEDFDTSGTLSGGSVLYADVASDLGAFTGVQGDAASYTLDHVSIRAIPEPATLGLVVAFGSGLLFVRRCFLM